MENTEVNPSPFWLLPVSSLPAELALDGLIVLGARLNPHGDPGRVAKLRLLHALHLWRQRCPEAYIIVTGGCRPGATCSEAKAMANWALTWVSEHWGEEIKYTLRDCLVLEDVSRTTAASARHTLPLVEARSSRVVGLVTDSLHIHRAHLLFKRQFAPQSVAVVPLPARGLVRYYWSKRRYLSLSNIALREGGAWLKLLGRLVLRRP